MNILYGIKLFWTGNPEYVYVNNNISGMCCFWTYVVRGKFLFNCLLVSLIAVKQGGRGIFKAQQD